MVTVSAFALLVVVLHFVYVAFVQRLEMETTVRTAGTASLSVTFGDSPLASSLLELLSYRVRVCRLRLELLSYRVCVCVCVFSVFGVAILSRVCVCVFSVIGVAVLSPPIVIGVAISPLIATVAQMGAPARRLQLTPPDGLSLRPSSPFRSIRRHSLFPFLSSALSTFPMHFALTDALPHSFDRFSVCLTEDLLVK